MIWIAVGALLISLVTTHAWWTVVRVDSLRQDVFDIRDALFDTARATATFDDPAYRDARHQLHAIARVADTISLRMIGFVLLSNIEKRERPYSSNPILQDAIDASLESCADRIRLYLMYQTFTGLVVHPVAMMMRMTSEAEFQLHRWVRRWLVSSAPSVQYAARHHTNAR